MEFHIKQIRSLFFGINILYVVGSLFRTLMLVNFSFNSRHCYTNNISMIEIEQWSLIYTSYINYFIDFKLPVSSLTGPGSHPASYPMDIGSSFPEGSSGHSMKLATQLHLVPKLRMRGVIPSLPHTSLWCGA
jgi:hypothetical protein